MADAWYIVLSFVTQKATDATGVLSDLFHSGVIGISAFSSASETIKRNATIVKEKVAQNDTSPDVVNDFLVLLYDTMSPFSASWSNTLLSDAQTLTQKELNPLVTKFDDILSHLQSMQTLEYVGFSSNVRILYSYNENGVYEYEAAVLSEDNEKIYGKTYVLYVDAPLDSPQDIIAMCVLEKVFVRHEYGVYAELTKATNKLVATQIINGVEVMKQYTTAKTNDDARAIVFDMLALVIKVPTKRVFHEAANIETSEQATVEIHPIYEETPLPPAANELIYIPLSPVYKKTPTSTTVDNPNHTLLPFAKIIKTEKHLYKNSIYDTVPNGTSDDYYSNFYNIVYNEASNLLNQRVVWAATGSALLLGVSMFAKNVKLPTLKAAISSTSSIFIKEHAFETEPSTLMIDSNVGYGNSRMVEFALTNECMNKATRFAIKACVQNFISNIDWKSVTSASAYTEFTWNISKSANDFTTASKAKNTFDSLYLILFFRKWYAEIDKLGETKVLLQQTVEDSINYFQLMFVCYQADSLLAIVPYVKTSNRVIWSAGYDISVDWILQRSPNATLPVDKNIKHIDLKTLPTVTGKDVKTKKYVDITQQLRTQLININNTVTQP